MTSAELIAHTRELADGSAQHCADNPHIASGTIIGQLSSNARMMADALEEETRLRAHYEHETSECGMALIAAIRERDEARVEGAKAEREACALLCDARVMALLPTDDENTRDRALEAMNLGARIRSRKP